MLGLVWFCSLSLLLLVPVCDVISEKRNDTKVRIDFAMLPIVEKAEEEGSAASTGGAASTGVAAV